MSYQWKLGLVALAVVALFNLGSYVRGKFDEADQAQLLRKQIAATAEKQDRMNDVAKHAEAALLTERQKSAMLGKKLGAIRASQTRPVCNLDTDVLGLLRDATGSPHAPR